jgi:hypothetical protein
MPPDPTADLNWVRRSKPRGREADAALRRELRCWLACMLDDWKLE